MEWCLDASCLFLHQYPVDLVNWAPSGPHLWLSYFIASVHFKELAAWIFDECKYQVKVFRGHLVNITSWCLIETSKTWGISCPWLMRFQGFDSFQAESGRLCEWCEQKFSFLPWCHILCMLLFKSWLLLVKDKAWVPTMNISCTMFTFNTCWLAKSKLEDPAAYLFFIWWPALFLFLFSY